MRSLLKRFIILISFIAGLYPIVANPDQTLAQSSDIPGVDLFILIDQSLSMSGFDERQPNDPDNLRIDTAQYLIDYLGFDAITHPDNNNRISVIGFGNPEDSLVMVPLTSISGKAVQQSDQVLQEIKSKIVPLKLGNTSVVSAIDLVDQELSQAEDLGTNRKRIVVIITDGTPYDSRKLTQSEYFEEINEHYTNLPTHYNGRWGLFVVGIDTQGEYWPFAEPEWQRIAQVARRVQQSEAMKTELVQMLSPELGYEGNILNSGEIFVEPYLETVNFSIFKYSSDTSISISYPGSDGNLVHLSADDPQVLSTQIGDRYEIWAIQNPSPGTWEIEQLGSGRIDIFKQIQFSSVRMEYPKEAQAKGFPFYFQFALPGSKDLQSTYPLDFQVTVFPPNDDTGVIIPCCTLSEEGAFRAAEVYNLQEMGQYRLHVQVSTKIENGDSPEEIVISDEDFNLSTYDVVLNIEDGPTTYLQYSPVPEVVFQFTDSNGKPVLEDPTTPLELFAQIIVPSGQITTIPLQRVDQGKYRTTQAFALPGNGPKGINVVAQDEEGDQLFEYKLQVNTFRNLKLADPLPLVPLSGKLSSLAIQLLDQGGKIFTPSDDQPLIIEATIFPVHGEQITGALDYDPNTETFHTNTPWSIPTDLEGDYTVSIVGKSEIDDQEIVVFEDNLTYSVTASLPYYKILSPSTEVSSYPLHDGLSPKDMLIAIQWVQDDQPIDPTTVFRTDPASLVKVDIVGPGNFSIFDLSLSQLSEADPSIWGVSRPELRSEGLYTATFHFQNATLVSQEPYMSFDNISVPFVRIFTSLWRGLRFAAGILASMLVAVVVLWSGRELYERRVPPFPKGTVSILEYNSGDDNPVTIAHIDLLKQGRRTIEWKLKTDKAEALGLHKMIIQHCTGRLKGQQEGIKLDVFNKQKQLLFQMIFDRGERERRIPRLDSTVKAVYRVKYVPPAETN